MCERLTFDHESSVLHEHEGEGPVEQEQEKGEGRHQPVAVQLALVAVAREQREERELELREHGHDAQEDAHVERRPPLYTASRQPAAESIWSTWVSSPPAAVLVYTWSIISISRVPVSMSAAHRWRC